MCAAHTIVFDPSSGNLQKKEEREADKNHNFS